MKKILFILILLLIPGAVVAQTYISEIMYDVEGTDSGREWIEIHNDSDSEIDLSTYFLYETNVAHKITHISGPATLSTGDYAIIASDSDKFLVDNPGFSGSLFDSVFSLNNSGEELVLLDPDKNEVDLRIYSGDMGAGGTGNSLQITSGSFIPAEPTPGAINATVAVDEGAETEGESGNSGSTDSTSGNSNVDSKTDESTHSSQNPLSDYSPKANMKIGIGRNRRVLINSPVEFIASLSADSDARFKWSFGNGGDKRGKKVNYIFNYPGKYNVVLNSYIDDDQITSRSTIEAIKPDFSIGIEEDSVFIQNNLSEEVNIGKFIVKSGSNSFIFPQDTILSPGQKILISETDLFLGMNIDFLYPNKKPAVETLINTDLIQKVALICEMMRNADIECDKQEISDFFDKI